MNYMFSNLLCTVRRVRAIDDDCKTRRHLYIVQHVRLMLLLSSSIAFDEIYFFFFTFNLFVEEDEMENKIHLITNYDSKKSFLLILCVRSLFYSFIIFHIRM